MTSGATDAQRSGNPASAAARTPAAMPWRIASPVENEPVTAPATSMGPAGSSGTKAPIASSQRVVPRTWLHRWIAGFQPPDTATRSHGIRATIPSAVRTATDTTRSSPVVAATSAPVWTGMRASRARATVSEDGDSRASTTAATSTPARASDRAA